MAQIKRKFNTFRFYLQSDCSQALDELICMVENNCWQTCECCGGSSGLAKRGLSPICVRCESNRSTKHDTLAPLEQATRIDARLQQLAELLAQRPRY